MDGPGRVDPLQYVVDAGRAATEDAIFDALGAGVAPWMLLTELPSGRSVLQVPPDMVARLEGALTRHDLPWERLEKVPPLGRIQRLNTLLSTTEDEDVRRRVKRKLVDLRNRRSAMLAGEVTE